MKIKIALVDDNSSFRKIFHKILLNHDVAEEIYESDSGEAAVQAARNHHPDLIFMDIAMPRDGFFAAESIHRQWPEIKIVILTVHEKSSFVIRAFQLGASGYLLKRCLNEELLEAIKTVMNGGQFISREIDNNTILKGEDFDK